MSQLSLEIVTPSGLIFQEDVYQVLLPTPEGQIGIRPHHIPVVTLLVPGVISVARRAADTDEQWEHIATAGGFVEIDDRQVRVLADVAERAEDIDELKAKEALTRAVEMKQTQQQHVSLADATGLLELNTARLKVAELRRKRPPVRRAGLNDMPEKYGSPE